MDTGNSALVLTDNDWQTPMSSLSNVSLVTCPSPEGWYSPALVDRSMRG